MNEKGMTIEESKSADYLVLRESERTISIPLKKTLSPGKYKLIGKLDQGMSYPVQELEKEFEVSAECNETKDSKEVKGSKDSFDAKEKIERTTPSQLNLQIKPREKQAIQAPES